MSRNNVTDTWDPEEHPSLELLRKYQTGELPAPQSHRIEQHLLSCELCTDLVEGMALSKPANVRMAVRETRGRLKNLLAQKKRKRRVFQWPVWQTAAVLLVLTFAIAEVVYHHYFARPSHFGTAHTSTQKTSWQVKGRVSNVLGQVLAGANIQVKNHSMTTKTDQDGNFSLTLDSDKPVLIVSYPGCVTREVMVQQSEGFMEVVLTQKH